MTAELAPIIGRPPLITDERRVNRIIKAIEKGCRVEVSASKGPVHKATLMGWLARGRSERARLNQDPTAEPLESEAIYLDFLDRVERARDDAENALVEALVDAGLGEEYEESTVTETTDSEGNVTRTVVVKKRRVKSVPAIIAWLERTRPAEYSRTIRSEITGADGGPVRVEETIEDKRARALALVDDELRAKRIQKGLEEPIDVDSTVHDQVEDLEAIAEGAAIPWA